MDKVTYNVKKLFTESEGKLNCLTKKTWRKCMKNVAPSGAPAWGCPAYTIFCAGHTEIIQYFLVTQFIPIS